jgi:hypothetical protein
MKNIKIKNFKLRDFRKITHEVYLFTDNSKFHIDPVVCRYEWLHIP